MAVTLHVDLPLDAAQTPTATIKEVWPNETAISGSPFTLVGSGTSAGRFTVNIGTPTEGIHRVEIKLGTVLIALGYISVTAGATDVRMVDDPASSIDPAAFASAIASSVAQSIIAQMVARFALSSSISGGVSALAPVVTRDERLQLGPMYCADFSQYLKTDNELVITIHPNAKNATGRLVWTAKPDIAGADATIAIQVDSVTGLVKPSGGGIVAGDGSIVGIVDGSNPIRQVRVTLKARALSTLAAGRLYWDLRRYDASPAAVWSLGSGVIDLFEPVNRATS